MVRQDKIWEQRGYPYYTKSLVETDEKMGEDIVTNLPDPEANFDPEKEEQNELLEFCRRQLIEGLEWGIEQGIRDRMAELKKSKKYVAFVLKFIPGLKLSYCQSMSQRQIAEALGMTNQAQVSRVLNPKELLTQVRFRLVDRLLNRILAKARELGLTKIPPEPDYLRNLMYQLEVFVDQELFNEAIAQLSAGTKNRSMNSRYAEYLCRYLNRIN